MTETKRVLLIIGGGVAAYKVLELIRILRRQDVAVRCVLTKAAQEFVTPLSVAGLSNDKVYTDLFSLTDEAEMGHIALSRSADLVLVAPATADLMARMAQGRANDLASTVLLATDAPVLIAPAMNVRMWHHPATVRNLALLKEDGIAVVDPAEGEMACGEYGIGRLSPIESIAKAVQEMLAAAVPKPSLKSPAAKSPATLKTLLGQHVLVTSGPTFEAIDPVRYVANRSSGKQGHAIAAAAAAAGARVTLIAGPVSLPDPAGVQTVHVETALEMAAAVEAALPADVGIFAAAVADWRIDHIFDHKLKKEKGEMPDLKFVENPDILKTVCEHLSYRPRLVVGFSAETSDVIAHAKAKRARKGCDWIIANDVSTSSLVKGGVMGSDFNAVSLVTERSVDPWPVMAKAGVASVLVARIAAALAAMDKA